MPVDPEDRRHMLAIRAALASVHAALAAAQFGETRVQISVLIDRPLFNDLMLMVEPGECEPTASARGFLLDGVFFGPKEP